jgi:hypothetical protein
MSWAFVGAMGRGDYETASRIFTEEESLKAQQRAAAAAEEHVRLQREQAVRTRYVTRASSQPEPSRTPAPAPPAFLCPHCGSGMPGRFPVCAQCRRDVFWVEKVDSPFTSAALANEAVTRLSEQRKAEQAAAIREEQCRAQRSQVQKLVREAFTLQRQIDGLLKKLTCKSEECSGSTDEQKVLHAVRETARKVLARANSFLAEVDTVIKAAEGVGKDDREAAALRASRDFVEKLSGQLAGQISCKPDAHDRPETQPAVSTDRNLAEIADLIITLLACMAAVDAVASDSELAHIVAVIRSTGCPLTETDLQQRVVIAAVHVVKNGVHQSAIHVCQRLRQIWSEELSTLVSTSLDLVAMDNGRQDASERELFTLICQLLELRSVD